MKSRLNQNLRWWNIAAFSVPLSVFSLFLAGCNLPAPQADTVRHFTLESPAVATPVANGTKVRPVHVAGHLHGRVLAVRVSEHEVVYLEDFRWAEPLDDSITQLLRARLGTVGGGATVSVEIDRCELVRSDGNNVQLTATYSILMPEGDKASPQRGVFTATRRIWDGKDYNGLVGLIDAAVGELGDAIAAALAEKK
jgi:hypothetical protein